MNDPKETLGHDQPQKAKGAISSLRNLLDLILIVGAFLGFAFLCVVAPPYLPPWTQIPAAVIGVILLSVFVRSRARDEGMNGVDRLTMKLRQENERKTKAVLAASPGLRYWPTNWHLVLTAFIFMLPAGGIAAWALMLDLWIGIRLFAGAIALFFALMSIRAIYRVIYRTVKQRDI